MEPQFDSVQSFASQGKAALADSLFLIVCVWGCRDRKMYQRIGLSWLRELLLCSLTVVAYHLAEATAAAAVEVEEERNGSRYFARLARLGSSCDRFEPVFPCIRYISKKQELGQLAPV